MTAVEWLLAIPAVMFLAWYAPPTTSDMNMAHWAVTFAIAAIIAVLVVVR